MTKPGPLAAPKGSGPLQKLPRWGVPGRCNRWCRQWWRRPAAKWWRARRCSLPSLSTRRRRREGCAAAGGHRQTRSSSETVLRCDGWPVVAAARLWRLVRAWFGSRGSGSCGLDLGVACWQRSSSARGGAWCCDSVVYACCFLLKWRLSQLPSLSSGGGWQCGGMFVCFEE
jgi:hypothetical protein